MTDVASKAHLTSGRHLARNSFWNLAGQLLPMAAAVFAIPPTIRGLGVPRFGVLSLAWIILGYFGLFDLGIGRALTKLVADCIGADDLPSIPTLAWTSLLLILLLGIAGGVVVLAITPWLVYHALKIPAELQGETVRSMYLLALAIPTVTVTSGLRGILEAMQRFRILNLIRIPMSVFSFVAALLVLPFSHSLVAVVAALIAGRLIAVAAHLFACFHALPALRHHFALRLGVVLPALRFGSWMTVSNVVGPIMLYIDRFIIGALLSVTVLAYYTAPFDMINRVLVVPAAVAGVLFPAFTVSLLRDPGRVGLLLGRGVKYVVLAVFPIVFVVTALAPEGLRLWLGPVFAQNGATVLRWLAAGVFINAIAQQPFALIQGAGRPDLTAKLHLLELPLYLASVWFMTRQLGITGTAIAWTARVMVDTLLLCFFATRWLSPGARFFAKATGTIAAALVVLYAMSLPQSVAIRAGMAALGVLGFAVGAWFWALRAEERALLFPGPTESVRETMP